jgi:hypothetical protein
VPSHPFVVRNHREQHDTSHDREGGQASSGGGDGLTLGQLEPATNLYYTRREFGVGAVYSRLRGNLSTGAHEENIQRSETPKCGQVGGHSLSESSYGFSW